MDRLKTPSLRLNSMLQTAGGLGITNIPIPQYEDVELTEEETAEVLRLARKAKSAKLKELAYQAKISQPVVFEKPGASELLERVIAEGKQNIRGFTLDYENMEVYNLLSLYFSGDPRFEQSPEGYRLEKGLLMFGNVGCGKTTALKLFSANPVQGFAVIACREVADEFQKNGAAAMEFYRGMLHNTLPALYYGQRELGICFDDLGTEPQTASHYSNKVTVMAEILLSRYDRRTGVPTTHVTTNLSESEIEEHYGNRVLSRMREMFNIIEFPETAKDRRK